MTGDAQPPEAAPRGGAGAPEPRGAPRSEIARSAALRRSQPPSVAPWAATARGTAAPRAGEGAGGAEYAAAARELQTKVKTLWKTAVSVVATRYADDAEAKRILSQLLDVPNASEEVLRIVLATTADRGSRMSLDTREREPRGGQAAAAPIPRSPAAAGGAAEEAAPRGPGTRAQTDARRADAHAAPTSYVAAAAGGTAGPDISSVETHAGAAEFGPDGVLLADSPLAFEEEGL